MTNKQVDKIARIGAIIIGTPLMALAILAIFN